MACFVNALAIVILLVPQTSASSCAESASNGVCLVFSGDETSFLQKQLTVKGGVGVVAQNRAVHGLSTTARADGASETTESNVIAEGITGSVKVWEIGQRVEAAQQQAQPGDVAAAGAGADEIQGHPHIEAHDPVQNHPGEEGLDIPGPEEDGFAVIVRFMDDDNAEEQRFEVDPAHEIYEAVGQALHEPPNDLVIRLGGEVIENDGMTFHDEGIENDARLTVCRVQRFDVYVRVVDANDDFTQFGYDSWQHFKVDPAHEIYEAVGQALHEPPNDLVIRFGGEMAERFGGGDIENDGTTFNDAGIEKDDIVRLTVRHV